MLKLTLEEFVLNFGTNKQKENYWKLKPNKKGLRNINIDVMNSIIKSAETKYQTIEIFGKGAKREIILTGKYEVALEKEDGRSGRVMPSQLPFNRNNELDTATWNYLKTLPVGRSLYFTGLSLGKATGIIPAREKQLADCMYDNNKFYNFAENMVKEGWLPDMDHAPILKDVVMRITRPVNGYMETTLKSLKKKGLITYGIQPMVQLKNKDDRMMAPIPITPEDYARFVEAETKLLNQYGLGRNDLYFKNNTKEVREYNKAWKKIIKTIPYSIETSTIKWDPLSITVDSQGNKTNGAYIPCEEYTIERKGAIRAWEGFWIIVKGTEKDINIYESISSKLSLEDNEIILEQIWDGRFKYIVNKASERQIKYIENNVEVEEEDLSAFMSSFEDEDDFVIETKKITIYPKDLMKQGKYANTISSCMDGLMSNEKLGNIEDNETNIVFDEKSNQGMLDF